MVYEASRALQNARSRLMRIQFELSDELWERAARYIPNASARHVFGQIAFEEWVNRREGRDRKLNSERIQSDAGTIRAAVEEVLRINHLLQ